MAVPEKEEIDEVGIECEANDLLQLVNNFSPLVESVEEETRNHEEDRHRHVCQEVDGTPHGILRLPVQEDDEIRRNSLERVEACGALDSRFAFGHCLPVHG